MLLTTALAIACGTAEDAEVGNVTSDSAPADAAVIDTTTRTDNPAASTTADSLRAALLKALRGPAQSQPGEHSWFSAATANALRSVSVDSAGHATVDFEDLRALIPNASSSAGSTILLKELNATVFGVAGVRSADYLIEGSCEKFWEWLQYSCQTVQRENSD